jgi:hypothetical protein
MNELSRYSKTSIYKNGRKKENSYHTVLFSLDNVNICRLYIGEGSSSVNAYVYNLFTRFSYGSFSSVVCQNIAAIIYKNKMYCAKAEYNFCNKLLWRFIVSTL